MIIDAIANIPEAATPDSLQASALRPNSKSIIHRVLKFLLASDVPFRRLHQGVAKEKLNLLQFASTSMAEAGADCDEDRGVPDCLCRPA